MPWMWFVPTSNRDQLTLTSKGSTLNVGNLIAFRTTGRDSYELASQFDTALRRLTPGGADHQDYQFHGNQCVDRDKSQYREGKLYQEVELPRRPYNDVEAEMANRLSILPNYEAWCRLIKAPKDKSKRPKLAEYHIQTEELGVNQFSQTLADYVRERSRSLAKTREDVEKEIIQRSNGKIKDAMDVESSEIVE